jgi:DNA repair protein RecO (recombination protein O)
MPLVKTPAVALKSRKWGDADRIVTFYTLRFGKVRGVARGARRIKSRFGSALEPFVHCDLNLFEKAHDPLYRVTQADIRESFSPLREDLALMAGGARLANLVAAVTAEGDPGPAIFQALLVGRRSLQANADPAFVALLFQIRLLGLAGFRPQVDQCACCGKPLPVRDRPVPFFPASGGATCESCAHRRSDRSLALSPGSLALLQHSLRWPVDALTRLKATVQMRAELEAAVDAYITVVAGRRLPPVDFLVAEPTQPLYGLTK